MKRLKELNTLRPAGVSVTVIIPCRNESKQICKCLESVLSQVRPEGGYEVIIADGMSDDGTREVIDLMLEKRVNERNDHAVAVHVIDNPLRIVSAGLNCAIRAASGNIIVRLDAHSQYAPDYIEKCLIILQESGADNVGGPWVASGEGWVTRGIAAAFQSPFAAGGARGHNPDYEGQVDTVYLGCWPKETFDKYGYFDEELVRNQDDEHNLRITRGGGKIYQSPKIRSWYRPRASLAAVFRQYMQYGYWKVRVIQKHRIPASWRHLVPGAFVFILSLLALCTPLLAAVSLVSSPSFVVPRLLLPASLLGFSFLLVSYLSAVLLASVLTAAKTEWKLLPILPSVFPCYHFGYGYGFLRGIWDFVIRRKAPSVWSTELTRGTAAAER